MPPQLATVLFASGIAGFFWLDRDAPVRTSKSLWLPIVWFSISASRSLSAWLGMGAGPEIPGQEPPQSSLDQFVAGTLILLGAIILIRRRRLVNSLLKANWPITLYFSFCLVSLVWSDFPGWGFKRWVRGLGDLIMVLVVATDAQPVAALKRFFLRIGFVLLPASVLLIRYYPELGMGFDAYGHPEWTGVSTNKNALGNLAYIVVLAALWQVLSLVRDGRKPHRNRRLFAQCVLIAFGIDILFSAHSASPVACCILGSALMLATSLPLIRRNPAAVHALMLIMLIGGGLTELLGGRAAITEALGRKPDLTGRTEIWGILIPLAPNPIGGAGFETFWVGPRVATIARLIGGLKMTNEAHNGYIEVYLNLGWLGLGIIALLLGQGYSMAVRVFRRDLALGSLLMAYVVTAAFYGISEAVFRMLSLEWFILVLSVVVASRVTGPGLGPSQSARQLAEPAFVARESWPPLLEVAGQES